MTIALVAIAASSPQSAAGAALPSPSDIGVALTLERFDDRCKEPEITSCPMINIQIVEVRNPQCRVEPVPVGVEVRQAFLCRFESMVRHASTVSSNTSRLRTSWRRDEALMYLTRTGWRTSTYLEDGDSHP